MAFLITLSICVVLVLLLRNRLLKHPMFFYAVAVILDVLFFVSSAVAMPHNVSVFVAVLMRRGGFGMALFVIVMFIGVFAREGKVSRYLRPIRAELSILACILMAGHMLSYLLLYVPGGLAISAAQKNVLPALICALLLLALLLVLGITSARMVKRHMPVRIWSRVQTFAYAFYALAYIHLILMLLPSALSGGQPALTNVVVYSAVFLSYAALRIRRAILDRQ